jgi:acetyl-CoA synthase
VTLISRVFSGADQWYDQATEAVNAAVDKYGLDQAVSFGNTAYFLPCIYAMLGDKITTLAEMKTLMEGKVKDLMTREQRTKSIFTSGIASVLCCECIEACKYIEGNPYEMPVIGHLTDAEIREIGLPLVVDDIPGFVVMIGPAPSAEEAKELIKGYQGKGIMVFMIGKCIDQAVETNVDISFKIRIISCGYDLSSTCHVVSVALRAALIFGAITPGDWDGMWEYTMKRVHAFVNAFEPVDDQTVALGAGAIQLGFPVITNQDYNMWNVPKSLIIQTDTKKFDPTSIEARDIHIKNIPMDIPVGYAPSFEGEIIRRKDMQVEFDGSDVEENGFEFVRTLPLAEVEDHKIELIGPDLDEFEFGSKHSLAMVVEVAGKNMQTDFEPVFERKFHAFVNCLEGIMHTGQRDLIRVRVSKAAFDAGFRAKHFGEVLYAKVKSEYSAVVDKCQVKIITDHDLVKQHRKDWAQAAYALRDKRLESLTDENVDVFYTCVLCQAFSPSHVCVVTPERLGLCGAVSWLDAKATNELDPTGACQIITKNKPIDIDMGAYEDINEAVYKYSRGALERVTLYSLLVDPMTSCGCFEVICGIEPLSNGLVLVNREHVGVSPLGMTFADLASMTGGGVQTPGFMGLGKSFIASKKFAPYEQGTKRIVWMPKALKDDVREKLDETAKALYGIENFSDMIADETICEEDPEALMNFLTEKGHPVLELDPLM